MKLIDALAPTAACHYCGKTFFKTQLRTVHLRRWYVPKAHRWTEFTTMLCTRCRKYNMSRWKYATPENCRTRSRR